MQLSLENIECNLSKKKLLGGVNLSVDRGELTLLYGDNGSGKTSLIRVIAGLNRNYSGSVVINGEEVISQNHFSLVKRHCSILLTIPVRPTGMKVKDFLDLYSDERDLGLFDELYQLFSIDKLIDSYMDSISDGERQKVLLTKTLSKDVGLLILDEPSTYLDYNSKEKLYNFISTRLMDKGRAILLSTHDLHNAQEHISNSFLVNNGIVIETGKELKVFSD